MIFIYALVSSRDGESTVWYVGQSVDVQARFDKHQSKISRGRRGRWIQKELAHGFTVRPRLIEECPDKMTANAREAYWIDFFRKLNPQLTNGTSDPRNRRGTSLSKVVKEQRQRLKQDRKWNS